MLFKMAWRNLWRSRRRTLITLFSVAFGVWLAVTFTGMAHHSYNNMIDTSARMGFGHLAAQPVGYLDAPGLDKRIAEAEALETKLESVPGVRGAYVRISGQGMFATASKSVGGGFFAIDPTDETPEVNLFVRSVVEGALFDKADSRGIVVGKVMAEKMKLRLGKRVVYTLLDVEGEIVSEVARVSGIFETGVDDVDGAMVLLPIDTIRKTLGYEPGAATLVAFFVEDHRAARAFAESVGHLAPGGAEILSWQKTQASIAGLVEVDRSMNYLFQFLIGLLIAAGVLNTILMSVLERKREFGVMMAVGTTPGQLFKLASIEAFFVGLTGLFAGVLICIPWYVFMTRVGIDFTAMIGDDYQSSGVLMDPLIKLVLYPEVVGAILLGVLGLTMVAGLYPAYQAGRAPPVETLKEM